MPMKEEWKVYGKSGKPFSKEGLTKSMAKRQMIAVTLSELRSKGTIPKRGLKVKM